MMTKLFLTNLFNLNKKCLHEKIPPNIDAAYCPDCGKFIQNEWYITRCNCCGIKLKTMIRNGEVLPQNHYCTNCGSKEFKTEKLEKINFIDINFAVLSKKVVEEEVLADSIQCWQERKIEQPKLLVQYL